MRATGPALLAGSVLGLILALAASAAPDPNPVPTRDQVEKDLKLVALRQSDKVIEAGTDPWVEFALVNTSKTTTHRVAKPGDGSEVGWRDPYLFYTAEQRLVDGKWAAMNRQGHARCGLFDSDWPKDVIDLKPGEKLAINEWLPHPAFDFQYPGRVRLFGHYAYRATGGKNGLPRPQEERGRMAGWPLFEVVSEPLEFEVVRPLDLKVRARKPLKVGAQEKLSDVIEVTVTNTSDKPREVGTPTSNASTGFVLTIGADNQLAADQELTGFT